MTPTGYFLDHLWLIPLFPLATAALMLFFGKRLPKAIVSVFCVGSVGLSFIYAAGAVFQLLAAEPEGRVAQQILFEWLTPGPMQMTAVHPVRFLPDWGFLLDPLSCVMVLVVAGVGFLIHVYSVGYMAHEGGYYRFFGYMNLFMFAMLTLVLANNMLLMFVGWEGVGLCSYLLIGFYFLKKSASDAGKKAFIVNRIGGRFFQEIKNDQQVAAKADAFPSDEHEEHVVCEDQREHGEHEKIHVAEEAVVAAFVRHVPNGVKVNEEADTGDDQNHDAGKRIERS